MGAACAWWVEGVKCLNFWDADWLITSTFFYQTFNLGSFILKVSNS